MARIRSIKPDFWDSPGTTKASLRARLLYIAMWNYADDWGVGDGNLRRLASFAFPSDESSDVEPRNFRRLASEVAECYGVQWYEVDGRPFYAIPSWEKHQRTEKKAARRNPGPDQGKRSDVGQASEDPPPSVGSSEDGSRKGEVGKKDSSSPATPATPSDFDAWYEQYPRKVGKQGALKAYTKARKTTSAARLLVAVRRYAADPNLPAKEFIPHPQTWLNEGRWDDEPLPVRAEQQVDKPRPGTSFWDKPVRRGDD